MYEIGDVFISKRTRMRVKIVEIKHTQEMSAIVVRYRFSGDNEYLTAQELQREYGRELTAQLQPERGR